MKNPITLIILLLLLSGCMTAAALAGSTQTNTSGLTLLLKVGIPHRLQQLINLDLVLIVPQVILLTLTQNQHPLVRVHHHIIV